MTNYFELLHQELENRRHFFAPRPLTSVYFGGGTPSLAQPRELARILQHFCDLGFVLSADTEVTIEINPATLSKEKLQELEATGFNRFSVGAQTFHTALLQSVGRIHSAEDTLLTLQLLQGKNHSFDLLFALPNQTLKQLESDLQKIQELQPPHVSPYLLTVKDQHPLARSRLPEEDQLEFFDLIRQQLTGQGYAQYEISNYAKPGAESRHNLLYWKMEEVWGVGLSAHSFSKRSQFGSRFWNPSTMPAYSSLVSEEKNSNLREFPQKHAEHLQLHETLTDFFHTRLRMKQGFSLRDLQERHSISAELRGDIEKKIARLVGNGLLQETLESWSLTQRGQHLSNQVFLEFTFLP